MPGPPVTVMLKGPETAWSAVGGDPIAQGIVVESLTCSANESGPDACSFMLRRRADVQWPDLYPFSSVEVQVDGSPVWGGRIWDAPMSDTEEDSITVQCRGWQYHLDDDTISDGWVHTDLGGYQAQRDLIDADLTINRAGPVQNVSGGMIQLTYPAGTATVVGDYCAVTFDAGAALLRRAIVSWQAAVTLDANFQLYSRLCDSPNAQSGTGDDANAAQNTGAAPSILAHTAAARRRYHHLILYKPAAPGTIGQDVGVRISACKLFGRTRDESGDASALKAYEVVRDVLASGALPQLKSTTRRIAPTSFAIPDFWPVGRRTPREIVQAVNAYENNLIGVDAQGTLFYRERPSVPSIEVGPWSGSAFQDATSGSAEQLFSRVYVEATDAAGRPVQVTVDETGGLLDRLGVTRSTVFNVQSAVDSTAATQIGQLYLAEKARPAMKGSLVVQGPHGVRNSAGGTVAAAQLLHLPGELVRITHLVDPRTGGLGRDVTIRSVSYDLATDTATVELDNERGRLEALLQRLAVVTTSVLR